MGLAGRKQKQRISADPRNLTWADDASRFGLTYLSKFGWDASQGLGTSGDGMKTHLKVQQKLDMMGIGAQHQRDPNGIAWKQNKDFEALLKRLNESAEKGKEADGENVEREDGREQETALAKAFIRAQEDAEGKSGNESSQQTKKRKHKDPGDPDTSEKPRKKQKKEKHPKSNSDATAPAIDPLSEPSSAPSLPEPDSVPTPKPCPMAHRARIRAAKRIADKSASAISEILGIAPSSSTTTSSSPAPTPPSSSTPAPDPSLSLDNLSTSTKSVADYFKEKLLARLTSSSSSASSLSTPSASATPSIGVTRPGLGFSNVYPPDDEDERRGIGSQVPAVDTDGQDVLTEKQRRKAERKAEKLKRREAEASHAAPDVSTDSKEQMEEVDTERVQKTSKKDKQRKERQERKQQAAADQSNDNGDDIPSGSLPEPSKKPKKEPKRKRS